MFGRIRVGIFIQDEYAGVGLWRGTGDGREFDALFEPHKNKAYIEIDFDSNEIYVQVNPSCNADGRCWPAYEIGDFSDPADTMNRVGVTVAADGDLTVSWEFNQSQYVRPLTRKPFGPSIDGTLEIPGDWTVAGDPLTIRANEYPSYEVYFDPPYTSDVIELLRCPQSGGMFGAFGELALGGDIKICGPSGWQ